MTLHPMPRGLEGPTQSPGNRESPINFVHTAAKHFTALPMDQSRDGAPSNPKVVPPLSCSSWLCRCRLHHMILQCYAFGLGFWIIFVCSWWKVGADEFGIDLCRDHGFFYLETDRSGIRLCLFFQLARKDTVFLWLGQIHARHDGRRCRH